MYNETPQRRRRPLSPREKRLRAIQQRKQKIRNRLLLTFSIVLFAIVLVGCWFAYQHFIVSPQDVIAEDPIIDEPVDVVEDPVIEPEEDPIVLINYMAEGGQFELPIVGATGFAATTVNLRQENNPESELLQVLSPGTGFVILEEEGERWRVEVDGQEGWVVFSYCFINLPDIIPSIVYRITNAEASIFRSSGIDIPEITGGVLYDAWSFNERLGYDEFIAPVMYSMAPRIFEAQRAALEDGKTLVLYETFRPHDVQVAIANQLTSLANENSTVNAGLNQGGWTLNWFILTTTSNHQRGAAIDVSLAQVDATEVRSSGSYEFQKVTEYTELAMNSPMHELSILATTFDAPVNSSELDIANMSADLPDAVHELQAYMMRAGLRPIASEWWHFDDVESSTAAREKGFDGQFRLGSIRSIPLYVE